MGATSLRIMGQMKHVVTNLQSVVSASSWTMHSNSGFCQHCRFVYFFSEKNANAATNTRIPMILSSQAWHSEPIRVAVSSGVSPPECQQDLTGLTRLFAIHVWNFMVLQITITSYHLSILSSPSSFACNISNHPNDHTDHYIHYL